MQVTDHASPTAPADRDKVVFHAEGLNKIYTMGEVEVHALRGIDLDLYRGEFVVLLGPSGSGKSTLLNILGGLDVPTSGKVRYGDHDLSVSDDAALTRYRREHVGFVFQFYNLIPSLTARENVALVTEIARNPMTPEEALRMVGLAERMDHFPAQLSGGEQQRVAIARVGLVLKIARKSEGMVQPGEPLLEIGDPQLLEVVTEVLSAGAAQDGKARRRNVNVGERNGLMAQIVSGLTDGERGVIYPDNALEDGVRVTLRQ